MDNVFAQIARFAWPLIAGLIILGAALLYMKFTPGAFAVMLAGLLTMMVSEGLLAAEPASGARVAQPA